MDPNNFTIFFTGHRPNKLGGYDFNSPKNNRISNKIRSVLDEIVESKLNTTSEFNIVTGGALGIDQLAFQVCSTLRYDFKYPFYLMVAVPFLKQYSNWIDEKDIKRYHHQLKWADEVVYVDEVKGYECNLVPWGEYHPKKMQLRNEYMVDNSNMGIAFWDGSSGGTANCVRYAKKMGKILQIIDPRKI